MNDDCPCDPCFDPRNPTPGSPKRETTGSSIGSNDGVRQVQIVGQRGVDANNNPVWVGVEVTPDGRLKLDVDELPRGDTVTYLNDNLRLPIVNGRVIGSSLSGSGGWSIA